VRRPDDGQWSVTGQSAYCGVQLNRSANLLLLLLQLVGDDIIHWLIRNGVFRNHLHQSVYESILSSASLLPTPADERTSAGFGIWAKRTVVLYLFTRMHALSADVVDGTFGSRDT
jgi:hypothetical protein